MIGRWIRVAACVLVFGGCAIQPAFAQEDQSAPDQEEMVKINLPQEVDLRLLIDYVSDAVGQNILYGADVTLERVLLKTPTEVPKSALLDLLRSILKFRGFALVPTGTPGLLQVVKLVPKSPTDVVLPDDKREIAPVDIAVTQVINLRYLGQSEVSEFVTSLMSDGGSVQGIAATNQLILTDWGSNVARLTKLIEAVDVPIPEGVIEIFPVEHASAADLATKLTALFEKRKALSPGGEAGPAAKAVTFESDERSNSLLVVAMPGEIPFIRETIQILDVASTVHIRIYEVRFADCVEMGNLLSQLIGVTASSTSESGGSQTGAEIPRIVADERTNSLVVGGTEAAHELVAGLLRELDRETLFGREEVRFYQRENSTAGDVASTLMAIMTSSGGTTTTSAIRTVEPGEGSYSTGAAGVNVVADEATNCIVVRAAPAQHEVVKRIVAKLDERQPQVLIETTIITVDSTDDFNLAVQVETINVAGLRTGYEFFTAFGIGRVFPENAGSSFAGGLGANFAIVRPEEVPILIRALQQVADTRIVSAPRILVNNNITAELARQDEQPYTTVKEIQDGAPQVTFGGYEKAGVKLTVTPSISNGDFLRLEFEVELSSFQGQQASETVPPPKTTFNAKSEVTVPDGHTLIVGGLAGESDITSEDKFPFLSDIPILGILFKATSIKKQRSTVYVFIKPTILKDDLFRDLKFYSSSSADEAELEPDYPQNDPVLIPNERSTQRLPALFDVEAMEGEATGEEGGAQQ